MSKSADAAAADRRADAVAGEPVASADLAMRAL
jgi:hypothetical protein